MEGKGAVVLENEQSVLSSTLIREKSCKVHRGLKRIHTHSYETCTLQRYTNLILLLQTTLASNLFLFLLLLLLIFFFSYFNKNVYDSEARPVVASLKNVLFSLDS